MRAVYALITVFLLFCVFFTRLYLCDIWGPCASPGDKFVTGDTLTIVEILLMLLVAFLIGFAAAWLLRENTFRSIREQLAGLLKEKTGLRDQLQMLEKENQSTRKHLVEWQQEVANLAHKIKAAEALSIESQSKLASVQQDLQQSQRRYENLKQETDSIRDVAAQLTNELKIAKSNVEKLNATTETQPVPKPIEQKKEEKTLTEHFRSRFTPSSWETKDDLTRISGIGPVIQRNLNEIGIYSLQQISELTPDLVERVADAIKFFPDRIGRDNWIGQAAALHRQKK